MARHSHLAEVEGTEQDENETTEAGRPSMGDRLAAMDSVFLVRVGNPQIPVPVAPLFPADYDFPEANRERDIELLNWHFFYKAPPTCASNLGRTGRKDWGEADKAAYAHAYLNPAPIGEDGVAIYATVHGEVVKPYALGADNGGDDEDEGGSDKRLSFLEECMDRVRWDSLCATGKYAGAYEDHSSLADRRDRAEARKAMRGDMVHDVPGTQPGSNLVGTEHWHKGRTYGQLILDKGAEVLASRALKKERVTKAGKAKVGY